MGLKDISWWIGGISGLVLLFACNAADSAGAKTTELSRMGVGTAQSDTPKADVPEALLGWQFEAGEQERSKIIEALHELASREPSLSWSDPILFRLTTDGRAGRYVLLVGRHGAPGQVMKDGSSVGMSFFLFDFHDGFSGPQDIGAAPFIGYHVVSTDRDLDGDGSADVVYCTWEIFGDEEEGPSRPFALGYSGSWYVLPAPEGTAEACG